MKAEAKLSEARTPRRSIGRGWWVGRLAVASLALLSLGAGTPEGGGSGGTQVVATVGNHPITEQELENKIRSQMAGLEVRVYELKKQAIDVIADDYLIQQAAKKQNLSPNDYIKRELTDRIQKPTDAEAKKWYDDNKSQIKASYDKVKNQIISLLEKQRFEKRRDELVAELRKNEPIKIMIQPPRREVASVGHPQLGPDAAPITIVEFGDFQCPYCKASEDSVKAVREKYGDKVKLVYEDFPLSFHKHAFDAAKAAQCANEQGKFWPYHDQLFADQSKLAPADLKDDAKKLGLNTAQFNECFDKAKYESRVRADMAEGEKQGVEGTPTFFIDGRPLTGAQPIASFSDVIDEELAAKDQNKRASAH